MSNTYTRFLLCKHFFYGITLGSSGPWPLTIMSSDRGSDWESAMEAELHEVPILSQEALDCRSSSDAASTPEVSSDSPCTVWWAAVLFQASRAMGFDKLQRLAEPIGVTSGCTGCSAESFALKAIIAGLWVWKSWGGYHVGPFHEMQISITCFANTYCKQTSPQFIYSCCMSFDCALATIVQCFLFA